MKKTVCLLFLLLTACTTSAPIPTATPTAALPTSSPTIEPTATPDVIAPVLNDLKKDGISPSHEDGQWALKLWGMDIPGAYFDEDMKALHINVGGQQMDIPTSQVPDLVNVVDGAVVVNDVSGNVMAVFDTNISGGMYFLGHEYRLVDWKDRWVDRNEVVSKDPNRPVEISTWEELFAIMHFEGLFIKPDFPDNVYFPPSDKVWTEYQKFSSEGEFNSGNPFGNLDDLRRSMFKLGVNNIILLPNDAEGRGTLECITTQLVRNKDKSVSGLHFSSSYDERGRCIAFLVEHARPFEKMFILPTHTMDGNDLRISALDRNRRNFYKKFGYLGSNGDLILVKPLVIQWINEWQVPEEMQFVLLSPWEMAWGQN